MSRPKIKIDVKQFENLCGLQCTKEEIAAFFNCSEDTIDRFCKREYGESFAVVFHRKRGMGKISLRRKQWKLADKNASMAIWLGKQFLDQTDKIEATISEINDDQRQAVEDFLNDTGTTEDIDET